MPETFAYFLVEDPNTTALPLPVSANDRIAVVRGSAPNELTYYASPVDISETARAVLVVTPASGDTVTIPLGEKYVYINTGALAVLTILLPPVVSGNYAVEICPAAPIATLSIQAAVAPLPRATVPGAPTTGSGPGAAIVMRFIDVLGWRYWK